MCAANFANTSGSPHQRQLTKDNGQLEETEMEGYDILG
jgi:hypothetical protein